MFYNGLHCKTGTLPSPDVNKVGLFPPTPPRLGRERDYEQRNDHFRSRKSSFVTHQEDVWGNDSEVKDYVERIA